MQRHINNNVVVSNVAIGIEEGVKTIYNNDILSSLDKDHAEIGVNEFNYPNYKENVCYQLRMDTYLKNYNVPYEFDILVVDVEGKEDEVFYSFNLNEWRPRMIIVELVDDHQYFQKNQFITSRVKRLRQHIQYNNYQQIYRDDINTIFVRQ